MRQVTIVISDGDYADMVRHIERGNPGSILVGVRELLAVDDREDFNIEAEVVDTADASPRR